jgi:hypothetical protein
MTATRLRSSIVALAIVTGGGAFASVAAADDAACIAASEQEITLRKQGKLHAALSQLAACADAACPAEVKAHCAQEIDAIGSVMPTVVFAAKDGGGNDLFSVKVTMDGAPLVEALDGRPVAVDPGEHTFRFEMAGQPPVDRKLVIREGEKNRNESVVLGPAAVVAPPPPRVPPSPAPAPSTWSTPKTLAVVSGGVGVVGVGLGIVFGLYASSAQSREKSDCPSAGCVGLAQSTEDYDTAKKDATGSTIAFVAGGVLLAGGVVLWLTAPKGAGASSDKGAPPVSVGGIRLSPAMIGSGGGLVLGGDFL